MSSIPPPPLHPHAAPEKKGLSGLAWTGIGCGTLLLIIFALAIGGGVLLYKKVKDFAANPEKVAAEFILSTHPELQKVSSDEKKGEITIKTKTGEVFTVSYKDIAQGKFSFKDANGVETRLGGSNNIDDVPAWVPRVPKMTGTTSVFNNTTNGKTTGVYVVETPATLEEIRMHFENEAKRLGLNSSTHTTTTLPSAKTLTVTHSDETRGLTVNISQPEGNPTSVSVAYQEK